MKWNVGTKISAGFGITLAIFVIVGAVSYRSVTKQTEAAAWVAHTREVQNQLTELLASLQDAETGQRGYVITGVESYLAPPNGPADANALTDGAAGAPAPSTTGTVAFNGDHSTGSAANTPAIWRQAACNFSALRAGCIRFILRSDR